MKRTGEMILGIVGAVFYALMCALGIFLIWLNGNEQLKQTIQDSASHNSSIKTPINTSMMNQITSGGMTLLIASIIGLVLGIIALVLIKGNKKPKISGILFIVAGGLSVLISGGSGMLPAILYVIAGIMALARKQNKPLEEGY